MGDPELLQLFASSRDESAFTRLVERHGATVFGAALRKTGDRVAAQEISQTVFAVLARKAETLSGHPALGGWLYRAAVLEAAKHHRTESRRQRYLSEYAERQEIPDTQVPETGVLRDSIDAAVSSLPERDREVVVLRYFEDLGFEEIARRTGGREPALRMRLSRALKRLATRLARDGIGLPAGASPVVGLGSFLAGEGLEASAALPSAFASTTATAALQASPTLLTTTLATHTLQTMVTTKLKIAATAAAVSALAAVPIGTQWQANRTLRADLASQQERIGELEQALALASAPSAPAEESAPPGSVAAADGLKENETGSGSTASNSGKPPQGAAAFKSMFENPMMRKSMEQQLRAQVGDIYTGLFADLGYDAEESEVLLGIAVERKIVETMAGFDHVRSSKEERDAALEEAKRPFTERLEELLGPGDAAELAKIEKTLGERQQLGMVRTQLAATDQPLTQDQDTRLLNLLVESGKNSAAANDSERLLAPEESEAAIEKLADFHAEVQEQASEFLSTEQVAVLESTQKGLRDMVKMASQMTGAMGAGGGN